MRDTTEEAAAPRAGALVRTLACLVVAGLAGCEGGDLRGGGRDGGAMSAAPPFSDGAHPSSGVPVVDAGRGERGTIVAGTEAGVPLVEARVRLTGASPDVDEIDVGVEWRVRDIAMANLVGRATRLEAMLVGPTGERRALARTRVRAQASRGEFDLVLPLPLDGATLALELTGLEGERDGIDAAFLALDLPAIVSPPPVPTDRLESLSVSLVPGTSSSAVVRGRRVHGFAVRVDGELAPAARGGASEATARDGSGSRPSPAGPVAVTGLDTDVAEHFRVWEDGNLDPESPVRAAWRSEPVTVYLVLDTSASIVLAGAADLLLDAVTRTLAALSPVATFDYRTVSTEVRRVRGLRDVAFDTDTASGSGTAFHHAIDTVIDDIEARDPTRTLVIGFTDGRDFASRNFHPEFGSDERVRDHVTGRLRRLRALRSADVGGGHGLELHVASLGADVDVAALDALAEAGGGRHVSSSDAGALEAAFGELTSGLRGRYRLEYSSQRLADDAALELEVRAGNLAARVSLP